MQKRTLGFWEISNMSFGFLGIQIPEQWDVYSFKINFRNQILKVIVSQQGTQLELDGDTALQIYIDDKLVNITPNDLVTM